MSRLFSFTLQSLSLVRLTHTEKMGYKGLWPLQTDETCRQKSLDFKSSYEHILFLDWESLEVSRRVER